MIPRPLPAAEREAIALRYGVRPDLVPAAVTVCPAHALSIDATEPNGWRDRSKANGERMKRQAAMSALRERERKAAAQPEPRRLVMVSAPKPTLKPKGGARQRTGYRATIAEKDREWLRLVREGMTQPQAAVATGRKACMAGEIARRMRDAGEDYPRHSAGPGKKGPAAPTERDMAFLALLREGMGRLAAAAAVGCPRSNANRMVKRLVAAGHDLPPTHEAEGRVRGAARAAAVHMARAARARTAKAQGPAA